MLWRATTAPIGRSVNLAATAFQIGNIRFAYLLHESGLSINVMSTIDDPKERAVGLRLSEGMEHSRGAGLKIHVRHREVEAGRNHSRLVLRSWKLDFGA